MKKKTIIVLLIVAALAAGGAWFYNGYLYKSGRDIGAEKAAFSVNAKQLAADYSAAPDAVGKKYLNKAVEVSGNVTAVQGSLVTLDSVVACTFDVAAGMPAIGSRAAIKGRCIGYDELFGEVKLDQCTIRE